MKNSFYISNESNFHLLTYDEYEQFGYDANGNMLRHSGEDDKFHFWDESNRLRSTVVDDGKLIHYIYDASGERTLKAHSEYQGVFENGTPTDGGATLGSYTTYPSSYMTIARNAVYTKHYFAGTQRVASKPAGSATRFNVYTFQEYEVLKNKQLGDAQSAADSTDLGTLNLAGPTVDQINPSVYYFHPDHLGSSTVITDGAGYAYQIFLSLPFGETMAEQRRSGSLNNMYKFNGKELDSQTGLYYYGARYYDPRISLFISVDPLAEETMTPYQYTYQNPIRFIDPDGRSPLDVIITFNKSTGKLAIMDLDHYQKGLPTKTVSAKDYVHGGIRDANGKLTHNQILVMENVFSGGKSTNGVVERDPKRPQQKPIPNGTFDLLDNDADTKHTGWFRLDKQDENRYNDKDDATGRDGFRFHLGTESWGCVTCDVSQGDRQEEWNVVTEILNTTSTTTVPEKRGKQGWNPFSWLTNYGTVRVIGEDKIPTKKENE